jgi:hypothetical protein
MKIKVKLKSKRQVRGVWFCEYKSDHLKKLTFFFKEPNEIPTQMVIEVHNYKVRGAL